jgi:hypothetical protein
MPRRYVALLRAVNVGRTDTLAMSDLICTGSFFQTSRACREGRAMIPLIAIGAPVCVAFALSTVSLIEEKTAWSPKDVPGHDLNGYRN